MKKGITLFAALGLMMATTVSAQADTVENYVVDFNEPISTSAHNFRVADGWSHIVDFNHYVDPDSPSYDGDFYVEYSYDATNGLKCGSQNVGPTWGGKKTVYDLLVTPGVKGKVTLSVKQIDYLGYVEFYTIVDDQKGEIIGSQHKSELSQDDYTTITLTLDEMQKIGIRASNVYINNFTAKEAFVEPTKSMKVISAASNGAVSDNSTPTSSGGQIKWPADPTHKNANGNNMIKVSYMVTVQNNCNTILTQGTENYTVSIVNPKLAEPIVTVAVPQDLAPGQTSDPFEVTGWVNPYVDYNTSKDYPTPWSYSSDSQPFNVRENLDGTVLVRANGGFVPYEHSLVFRQEGTTSTSKFSSATTIAFGLVSAAATVNYEIFNNGVAPLEISSISISEPFTVSSTEATTIAQGATLPLAIEFPATATGSNAGDLTITYTDNDGTQKTVVLAKVSGTMLAEGTWSTAFGPGTSSSSITFPEGSIAEYSINNGYDYISSNNYLNYIKSSSSSNNKFYTPLLHATAGATMSFSAKNSSTTHSLKVYVTADRKNLGDPVETINNLTSSWEMKSITIPTEGDYYVVFELYNVCLDDIVGLQKVDVAHDLFIKDLGSYSSTDYQSGDAVSKEINVYTPLSANADDYTVEMMLGDEVVATIDSKALTAGAKTTARFNGSFTKIVETTTTLPFYWRFTFKDGGPVVVSDSVDLVFHCEPKFCFVTPGSHGTNYNAPDSKTSYNFGKVNTTNLTADYEIFNWGKAALNVKSITVPEGFSVNFEAPATIASREGTPCTITFSATEIGTYGGDIEITFVNAAGEDEVFIFAVSGTLLDPTKFYASFDKDGAVDFPAGSVYEKNIYSTNKGTYSAPNYVIYGTGTADNVFATPLLHTSTGESIAFDAKIDSNSWSEGTISVYAAATRADLFDEESGNRTLLTQVKGKDIDDETKLMTVDFKTFTAPAPGTGDFYIGFEITGRANLDEIYGFELVDVAHDIELAGFTAPASAMQNNLASATVQLRNFGFTAEEAGSYSAVVSVNGVETEVTDLPEIKAMLKSNDTPVSISVPFRYGKVGTFPVSVKLQFGDYTVETEAADVEFTEEVFSAEKQVGEFKELNTVPFHTNYKQVETVALYTPEMLGLNDGDDIASISLRGYFNVAHTSDVVIAYSWVDETTLAKPEQNTKFDPSSMTIALNQESFNWPGGGNKDEIIDLFTFNINETYAEGKSLMLMFGSYTTGDYHSAASSELSTTSGNCWYRQNDINLANESWGAKNLPVLHINLAVEPKTMSGTVTGADDQPVEGATVNIVATDGSGVEYSGTTGADGTYEIAVIQTNRTYDVTVSKDNLEATAQGVTFDESVQQDFKLGVKTIHIHGEASGIESAENVNVRFNLDLTPGYHALALPFAVNGDMVATLFGADAEIYTLTGTTLEDGQLMSYFDSATSVAAGEPFVVNVTATIDEVIEGVTLVGEPKVGGQTSSHITFGATYSPSSAAGKFIFDDSNFVAQTDAQSARFGRAKAAEADIVPAFHAVAQARPGQQIDSMSFAVDQTPTSINEITVNRIDGQAYNLRGQRSLNPSKGIFIVNGKKVLVK